MNEESADLANQPDKRPSSEVSGYLWVFGGVVFLIFLLATTGPTSFYFWIGTALGVGVIRAGLLDVRAARERNAELESTQLGALGLNDRGVRRKAKGDIEGAIKDYGEAIRLNPGFTKALSNRANALFEIGNIEGALKDYNEALRLEPDAADVYYNRAFAWEAEGNYAAAIADYNESLRLQPDDVDIYYNRAFAWEAEGNPAEAIADLQKYLGLGAGAREGDTEEVEAIIKKLQKNL